MKWFRSYIMPALVGALVCGGLLGAGWLAVDYYGLSRYTVSSGSMMPLYPKGTSVVVSSSDRAPEHNDIIMFRNPQNDIITTHIFGGYNPDGTLMTRGLANAEPDKFVPAPTGDDIVGTVVFSSPVSVPGYWTSLQGFGLIMIALAIVALLFMYRAVDRQKQQEPGMGTSSATEPASTPA